MNVDIATLDDLPAILALEANFERRVWSEQSWHDELVGSGRLVLIARQSEGQVVGVACFQHVDEVVDLHRIVVAPEERRLGFARVMLVAGLQWAIEQGASRVLLEVDNTNVPAIALYRGYGFRQVATRRDYYAPGRDALILERPLEGVDVDSVGMWDMEALDD
ncbi:ribosomal protein S18-alanine N-acetyltransferase [Tessaracoccus lubricantis]|uniref:Ribosomal protein S18-alanine N-acetyltransferase n=1 Tax=Tessaracoccus lubricantis TaxID=545543 RepID=A0ABP9FA43_9ACTN